ncbi:unnamed protein product [Owenia fusiformis]|uniref:Guanine nucleotide exchange factor VAV2 n=1 Tax=Owenia fusiformis TaxID=6347 RepID=A0A8S4NZN0_OWEFU|nr:unnamed protein product [Owenia fusiformis]
MANEDWRLCADWLYRMKILANDSKVVDSSAVAFDLAQTLRDGVLICYLLNTIKPCSIDLKEFSQRPQMSQFLCLKNIRSFLTACKTVFGFKESDLFDSYDLFDVKDFGKVIHTLSKLSKLPESTRIASGFSLRRKERKNADDEEYFGLEERATEQTLEDAEELYDSVVQESEEIEEDIYDDLCSIQKRRRPTSTIGNLEPKSKRDYCIKELVETEKNYVDALNMICTHFIKQLKNVLQPADREIIFCHIEDLATVHAGFYNDLNKACSMNSSSKMKISDCFIKWKKQFLIYGQFCANLPQAQEQIDTLTKKDEMINQSVIKCQKDANDGKFRLRDLLSVPMQRVLKYHLLLRELVKQTDKMHEDRQGLEKALEAMQDLSLYVNEVKRDHETIQTTMEIQANIVDLALDLSLYINEVKRDHETLQTIMEIQNSIFDLSMPVNTSLKDYGRLLKDGELRVKSHEDTRTRPSNRCIFLFDKVMLMCKSRGEQYSYKNALILSQYRVEENSVITHKAKDPKWSYQFMLVEKQNKSVFNFFAKTEDQKRKWIDAIQMAQDNTSPPGASQLGTDNEFIMYSFAEPTECDVCRKLLRGIFFQGYKCQKTNKNVHKECIKKVRKGAQPPVPEQRPISSPGHVPMRPPKPHGKVKAVNSYQGIPPSDGRKVLHFQTGDVIEVLNKDDDNWWEGRLQGVDGYFPKNYVMDWTTMHKKPSYIDHTPSGRPDVTPSSPGSPRTAMSPTSRPGSYVNLQDLTDYNWFVGELSREAAAARLDGHPGSTYLVRESIGPARRGEFALSIKYGSTAKHIKINRTPSNEFYIADIKVFKSIPELVEYYQKNSLEESFPELQTTLALPFKVSQQRLGPRTSSSILGYAIVLFDYAATAPNQLSLTKDERVAITSKAGGDKGWWKGKLMDSSRSGYFPRAYVEELDENGACP